MNRRSLAAKWALVIFFFGSALAFAQKRMPAPDPEIREELRIMKGVLKEMLSGEANRFSLSGKVEGFYLPDFGMVFGVQQSEPSALVLSTQFRQLKAQEMALQIQEKIFETVQKGQSSSMKATGKGKHPHGEGLPASVKKNVFGPNWQPTEAKIRELLKKRQAQLAKKNAEVLTGVKRRIQSTLKNIRDFFENYADAGDLLKPDQHIAVAVTWNISTDSSLVPPPVFFSVRKREILRFRAGQMSEKAFWAAVKKESQLPELAQKQVQILKKIFASALGEKTGYWEVQGEPVAYALPNYGIWFHLNKISVGLSPSALSFLGGGQTVQSNRAKRERLVQKYTSDLTKWVGQYGSTLRFLKPRQWILVSFRTGMFWGDSQSTLYLLRVQKADILSFRMKKIDLRTFRTRVEEFAF